MVPDGADDLLGPLLQRVEQAQAAQRAGTVRLPFEFMAMEALLVTVLPRAARARDRPGTGCGGSSLPHGACQKLCVKSCPPRRFVPQSPPPPGARAPAPATATPPDVSTQYGGGTRHVQ